MEQDAERLQRVEQHGAEEEQPEADDQDDRGGPQPLLEQPAQLGRVGVAAGDDPIVGDEAIAPGRPAGSAVRRV